MFSSTNASAHTPRRSSSFESTCLKTRNRIYERVFDRDWVAANMPGAEVRRQRRAFTRGLLRAAAVAAVVLSIVGWFAYDAIRQRDIAQEQSEKLEEQQATNRRQLYVANMNLAYQSIERGDFQRAAQILDEERAGLLAGDPRDFEYFRLWRILHSERRALEVGGSVLDIAYSPDGKRIAAASSMRTVAVWDAETGAEIFRTPEGLDPAFSLAISSDGKVIAAAVESGKIQLLDATTGAVLGSFMAGDGADRPTTVAFSPDGKVIATGHANGLVKAWDRATFQFVGATRIPGGGIVGALAVTPDGRRAAIGCLRGQSALVEIETNAEPVPVLFPYQDETVRPVAFSGDGRLLATVGPNGVVTLRDGTTGAETGRLPRTIPGIFSIEVSHDGRLIAMARTSSVVEVWDVARRAQLATYPERSDIAYAVAFSPDGRWLASGSADGLVKIRDLSAPGDSQTLEGHTTEVYSVVYSPDGTTMATASFDGTIGLWNAGTGERLATLAGHSGYVRSARFSSDGRMLVSGGDDDTVRVWDVATRTELATLTGHTGNVFSVAISPDGSTIASGSFDGTVRVWDAALRTQTRSLRVSGGAIECVAFSPDGSLLAAGGEDRVAVLWDTRAWQEVGRLEGHSDWVNAMAFSADGTTLATAGSYSDGSVRLWDVASRTLRHVLAGFEKRDLFFPMMPSGGRANSVVFSQRGTIMATTSLNMVKFFDVATGQEMATMWTGHEAQIYSLAFSPDGMALVTASEDGTARIHRASAEADARH